MVVSAPSSSLGPRLGTTNSSSPNLHDSSVIVAGDSISKSNRGNNGGITATTGTTTGTTSSCTNNKRQRNMILVGFVLVIYSFLMVFVNIQMMNRMQTIAQQQHSGRSSSIVSTTSSSKSVMLDALQKFVAKPSSSWSQQDSTSRSNSLLRRQINNYKNDKDSDNIDKNAAQQQAQNHIMSKVEERQRRILTAYIEKPWTDEQWKQVPLVSRASNKKEDLIIKEYPQLSSCRELPSQFPIDQSPCEDDPFLPWIHDVFPTNNGTRIQFVAQNKRRCNTGEQFSDIKAYFQPQAALFQGVPVKRMSSSNGVTRYRLVTSHKEADEDSKETRFICKFQPSGLETLSQHNVNYDWHTIRKGYKSTFTEAGFDVHMIWSSQLLFYCPVPPQLQRPISTGETVRQDYATLYVDLIPIRTKPRYGHPTEFLPPKYLGVEPTGYDAKKEWGENGYILPEVEVSGRWTNIPICRPPLLEHQRRIAEFDNSHNNRNDNNNNEQVDSYIRNERSLSRYNTNDGSSSSLTTTTGGKQKSHRLVACTWTSVGFQTRGNAAMISDGPERLRQWIEFHLAAGFDHMYIYDNSGHMITNDDQAASDSSPTSLAYITDQFSPRHVTRINWPAKICNNNKSNSKNKGERSSQYAAEASCMLRYGPDTDWMGQFDTDEYFVPLNGQQPKKGSLKHVLDTMDQEGNKILTFRSQRAMPRLDMIEKPSITNEFSIIPKTNVPFLTAYNCHKQLPPRTNFVPAEKQIYRPDYVKLHFVHYSTITAISTMTKEETQQLGIPWRNNRYKERHQRDVNESTEAMMVHTKKVTSLELGRDQWETRCKSPPEMDCKVGISWPRYTNEQNKTLVSSPTNDEGYYRNCFINPVVEDWANLLSKQLAKKKQ